MKRSWEAALERIWDRTDFCGSVQPGMDTGCWLYDADKVNRHGYPDLKLDGKCVQAHRFIYGLVNKELPLIVDHACRIRRCVNIDHLRGATPKQNAENRSLMPSASGIRGVRWHQGAWRCRVCHHGKRMEWGSFSTAEEAEIAVVAKRNELFTHNLLDRL